MQPSVVISVVYVTKLYQLVLVSIGTDFIHTSPGYQSSGINCNTSIAQHKLIATMEVEHMFHCYELSDKHQLQSSRWQSVIHLMVQWSTININLS